MATNNDGTDDLVERVSNDTATTEKKSTELAKDDPRRKENRPAGSVIPTRGNTPPPAAGAPTPVPPGPVTRT